jgi:bifunctional non-homologous end joining protein LigD
MKQISLFFKEGSSDKEYHAQLEPKGSGFVVNFQYGRRGSTLTAGTKTPSPLPQAKAEAIYDKLVQEKMAKGYTPGASGTPYVGTAKEERVTGNIPQLLNPIEEEEVEKYLADPAWGAQEKKDGKHVMIEFDGKEVTASNRKGLKIGIPEPIALAVKGLGSDILLFDGESIGEVYYVFDLLRATVRDVDGHDEVVEFKDQSYIERYNILDLLCKDLPPAIKLVPLAVTEKEKRELYARLKKEGREGIVFKRLYAPYVPGRPNSGGDMLKFKFYATASCVVGPGRAGKRSIGLLLMKGGDMVSVGNCTVPANQSVPAEDSIVEIRYLYSYPDGSLYQPVLLGVRDDIDLDACSVKQLKYKAEEE